MAEIMQTPTCPMSATCRGLMEKPGAGTWMIIPGVIFIILGMAIIMYPQILVWFVAIALIAMGAAMLMMVNFMRKIGKRIQDSHH